MASLGLVAPQQVRVQLDDTRYAVCTVVASQDSPSATQVVMTRAAITGKRLVAGASVTLTATVANNAAYAGQASWAAAGSDTASGGDAHDVWHTTATEISLASFPQLNAIAQSRTGGRFDRAVAFHAMSSGTAGCSGTGSACRVAFVGGGVDATTRDALITAIQTALAGVSGGSTVTVQAFPAGTTVGGSSSRNIVNGSRWAARASTWSRRRA